MQSLNDLEARAAELQKRAERFRQGFSTAATAGGGQGHAYVTPTTPITDAARAAFGYQPSTATAAQYPPFGKAPSMSTASPSVPSSQPYAFAGFAAAHNATPSVNRFTFSQSPGHSHQSNGNPPPAVLSSDLANFLGVPSYTNSDTPYPAQQGLVPTAEIHDAVAATQRLLHDLQNLQRQVDATTNSLEGYKAYLAEVSSHSPLHQQAVMEAVQMAHRSHSHDSATFLLNQQRIGASALASPSAPLGPSNFAPVGHTSVLSHLTNQQPPAFSFGSQARAATPLRATSFAAAPAQHSPSPPRDIRFTASATGFPSVSLPAATSYSANVSPSLAAQHTAFGRTTTPTAGFGAPSANNWLNSSSIAFSPSLAQQQLASNQRVSNATPFRPDELIEEVQAIARAREARDALRRQQNAYSPQMGGLY